MWCCPYGFLLFHQAADEFPLPCLTIHARGAMQVRLTKLSAVDGEPLDVLREAPGVDTLCVKTLALFAVGRTIMTYWPHKLPDVILPQFDNIIIYYIPSCPSESPSHFSTLALVAYQLPVLSFTHRRHAAGLFLATTESKSLSIC